MKKEIPPAAFVAAIVVIALVIGVFIFQQLNNNPPTPRPDPKFFGGTSSAPSAPQTK